MVVLLSGGRNVKGNEAFLHIFNKFVDIQDMFMGATYSVSPLPAIKELNKTRQLSCALFAPSLYPDFYSNSQHSEMLLTPSQIALVHGGAEGADTLGDYAAKLLGWTVIVCNANWNKYKKAAGIIRNQDMIDMYQPHVFLAFPCGESRGTRDCIRRIEKYKQCSNNRLLHMNVSEMKTNQKY